MDTGDDEDEEERGRGGEDIAKVKDNEIELPEEEEVEDSLGSTAGNFRVKKSRGKEGEVAHCYSAVWQDMELAPCVLVCASYELKELT